MNLFAHLCFDVEAVGRRTVLVKLVILDDLKLGVTKSSILVSTVNSEKKHLLLGGTECGWPPLNSEHCVVYCNGKDGDGQVGLLPK